MQVSFMWTHKEADLVPHPVVGLMLQVGDAEMFPHALGFESLDSFVRVSKQGPCFKAVEEDRGDKRRVELELQFKHPLITFIKWLSVAVDFGFRVLAV